MYVMMLETAGGQQDMVQTAVASEISRHVTSADTESSSTTPSKTDPARLHQLVNQRIEEILSTKQQESTTIVTTTHEVNTQ